jgi:hypothetical protein
MPLQKAADFKVATMLDVGLLQDVAQMMLYVLLAMYLIAEP